MGTITVKNADGDSVEVTLPNDDGRAAADNSAPVVLSTEDKAALDAVTTALTALVALLPAALGASGGLKVSGSGTALPVSGEFFQATQPVSAEALPLPDGAATDAKQPAIGTAGAAASDVLTVQGVAGMTALKVDGSAVTQPVSIAELPALPAGEEMIGAVDIGASLVSGTATRTTIASDISSQTILASNAARKGATICNTDANALLLDLSGGVAAADRFQVRLAQNASYEVGAGYTGAITGIWEADGAGQADVVEFT